MATSVLDNNIGSPNFNVYCSLEQADQFAADRLHADAWESADEETKKRALLQATRLLDAQYVWKGVPVDWEQPRDWPRYNVYDEDNYYIDYRSLPKYLIEATFEMAFSLIKNDRIAIEEPDTIGVESVKLGSLAVKFENEQSISQLKTIPDYITDLLAPLIRHSRDSESAIVKIIRA